MPHSPPLLQDLLVLLLASVPIAFFFHRLRLPTLIGFMITGVLIGPNGLGLIRDVQAIEVVGKRAYLEATTLSSAKQYVVRLSIRTLVVRLTGRGKQTTTV